MKTNNNGLLFIAGATVLGIFLHSKNKTPANNISGTADDANDLVRKDCIKRLARILHLTVNQLKNDESIAKMGPKELYDYVYHKESEAHIYYLNGKIFHYNPESFSNTPVRKDLLKRLDWTMSDDKNFDAASKFRSLLHKTNQKLYDNVYTNESAFDWYYSNGERIRYYPKMWTENLFEGIKNLFGS